ncbi:helix-turn-helix transcriptional regulator [Macrococcoides canis]|uniref:helix-turn-helix domain-containing protein n=1 Tax=Macrococcoides canis TaxID=1855823 RepID=UPI0020B7F439|nr:helix-turn-helix transcriptional regulator [Macrococcus canis]UTH01664.1 helix-turn-helix transcriptional regulator [Macrococcus canis]
MLTNLEKVRKEKGVSLVDIADTLKVRYQTVSDKINGKSEFKFGEALIIKNVYFPEYDIEFLFASDEKNLEKVGG